jgi:hypothetical protein
MGDFFFIIFQRWHNFHQNLIIVVDKKLVLNALNIFKLPIVIDDTRLLK